MNNKRSFFEVLCLPEQFKYFLCAFTFILVVAPYFSGLDFGIVKIPTFTVAIAKSLKYIGPVALILVICSSIRFFPDPTPQPNPLPEPEPPSNPDRDLEQQLPESSRYRHQSIPEIMTNEAIRHNIHIEGININDRLTLDDLVCLSAPDQQGKSKYEVNRILKAARAKAYTDKYSKPYVLDEKLIDITSIKLDGIRPWEEYLVDLLEELGIGVNPDTSVLNVGIGHGKADQAIMSRFKKFEAVDVSAEALDSARNILSGMIPYEGEAEDLSNINNRSVDLYLSLRTYQSTLFNRRVAIREACRVLRSGGFAVISIPQLFIERVGENLHIFHGLKPLDSNRPSMEYANDVAARVKDYMITMCFADVNIDGRSPFELFIYGRRR